MDAGREAIFGGVGKYQTSQNPGSAAGYHRTLHDIRNPVARGPAPRSRRTRPNIAEISSVFLRCVLRAPYELIRTHAPDHLVMLGSRHLVRAFF